MIKKVSLILGLIILSTLALAAGIKDYDWDELRFGGSASGTRSITFDKTPDGSSAILSVDPANEEFVMNNKLNADGSLDVTGELNVISTTLGSQPCPVMTEAQRDAIGTPSDGDCIYNSDSKAINTYNSTASRWVAVGTGGGGGGGENFNNGFVSGQNPDAEEGTAQWTASAGSFGVDTTDPLEGDQSFTWTPAAQNDTLESAVLDFDRDIFYNRSCQAKIEYIGGDSNLTLKVIDANDDELGSKQLEARSISGPESVFFLCPTASDISGDANKGDLRLVIENTGASASAQIKFDKSYVGTLIGLSTASARMNPVIVQRITSNQTVATGTFTLIDFNDEVVDADDIFNTSTDLATLPYDGVYKICFRAVSLSTGATGTDYQWALRINGGDATLKRNRADEGGSGITTECLLSSRSAGDTVGMSFFQNSGSNFDVQVGTQLSIHQVTSSSVQIYKSIPTTIENINEYTGFLDGSASTFTLENVDWVTSVTDNGAGDHTLNLATGIDGTKLICNANGLGDADTTVTFVMAAGSVTSKVRNSNVKTDRGIHIKCTRSDDTFKLPTVQPIIVGQLTSDAPKLQKHFQIEVGANATINADPSGVVDTIAIDSGFRDAIDLIAGTVTATDLTWVCHCQIFTSGSSTFARGCSASVVEASERIVIERYDIQNGGTVSANRAVGAYVSCTGNKP